jgi:ADP-heptose:LPS heptosyltransferase
MSRLGIRLRTIARALASTLRPRRAAGAPVKRVLVAHDLLLGDTILLAPLLKTLAARYPDAERVVLAKPAVATLFAKHPYGVTVLPFDRRDPASQRAVIDSGPYDLALVPDDNRYAWLARAAGARRVVGFADDRPAWKNWMLDRAVPYPDAPDAWADIAARLLCDITIEADPLPFTAGEWPAPDAVPFDRPKQPYAVLHVGASTPLKQWPADRWRALADALASDGTTIVWTGGANERPIFAAVGAREGEVDLVGKLDLPQLFALLGEARRLVCPDTGIAHLARVVGVPTVALFGPGSRIVHGPGRFWSTAPFEAVTVDDFACRDQRTLYRREVAWVRRCGRRFDAAASPAGAGDPRACGRALCMEAIDDTRVIGVHFAP